MDSIYSYRLNCCTFSLHSSMLYLLFEMRELFYWNIETAVLLWEPWNVFGLVTFSQLLIGVELFTTALPATLSMDRLIRLVLLCLNFMRV